MGLPRKALISVDATPYYHCVSCCVRRAFLCGRDERTGQSFEHRRQWIEDRILALGQIFALDICAYAVMSNHYHVVLHINAALASDWNLHEVVERWHRLCKGSTGDFLRLQLPVPTNSVRQVSLSGQQRHWPMRSNMPLRYASPPTTEGRSHRTKRAARTRAVERELP